MFKQIKYLSLAVLTSAFLIGCGGGDGGSDSNPPPLVQDAPGHIQGLGTAGGKVQGQPFSFPAGITSTANWDGMAVVPTSGFTASQTSTPLLLVDGAPVDRIVGNGFAVTIRVPLTNTTDKPIDVRFPAGLVVISDDGSRQNGVLLSDVVVTVRPHSTLIVGLTSYCGNFGIPGSDSKAKYGHLVVSSSATLNSLTSLLVNKKINSEMFSSNDRDYFPRSERLQTIVHKLTDQGLPLDAADRAWIDTLPNK